MESINKQTVMDVSIIFVNYNTIKLLTQAINSVYAKTEGITYEIIVIDNNSSDNSAQVINNTYKDIKYVALPENIGFGRANNEGFKIAKGRNILCLNPDTILKNNAIKILSDYLDANNKEGAVGSQLYNKDGSIQQSASFYYISLSSCINDLFGSFFRQKHKLRENPFEVASVFGAAMMVKNYVVQKTNGFDPRFFMYAEEEDWCRRIHKLGYKIVCVPASKVTHLDGGSFEFSEKREERRLEGELNFYNVNYSPKKVTMILFVKRLTILSRITIFKILGNKDKIERWNCKLKIFKTIYK